MYQLFRFISKNISYSMLKFLLICPTPALEINFDPLNTVVCLWSKFISALDLEGTMLTCMTLCALSLNMGYAELAQFELVVVLAIGIKDLLYKPVEIEELAESIRFAIEGKT